MQQTDKLTIQQVFDSEQIITVLHAAYKRYAQDPMPSSALAETAASIDNSLQNGLEIYGAYLQNELVAIVKIETIESGLYFSRLAVHPLHQKKGIASSLLHFIEQLAAARQLQKVQCLVRLSEQNNVRLYAKHGYTITKEQMTTSPSGWTMPTVTMEKRIG